MILVTRVSKYLCYLCPCGDRKTSLARLVLFPIEIGISNFVQRPASNGAIASTIRKGLSIYGRLSIFGLLQLYKLNWYILYEFEVPLFNAFHLLSTLFLKPLDTDIM